MFSGPPDSWYDPPEPKIDLEIKWEKTLHDNRIQCDKCEEVAEMEGEIGDVRNHGGSYFCYCKNHYDTIIEDTIEEIENYEPDYEED